MPQIIEATPDILRARQGWQYTGVERPSFAEPCEPPDESVWDFPRPPRIEPLALEVVVSVDGAELARSARAVRVLETAGAPTVYVPPDEVSPAVTFGEVSSVCEWKGLAQPALLADGTEVGWRYAAVFEEFAELYLWVSFYPSRAACELGGERVKPQPGGYYGGWVTGNLKGPIKGQPGSAGW